MWRSVTFFSGYLVEISVASSAPVAPPPITKTFSLDFIYKKDKKLNCFDTCMLLVTRQNFPTTSTSPECNCLLFDRPYFVVSETEHVWTGGGGWGPVQWSPSWTRSNIPRVEVETCTVGQARALYGLRVQNQGSVQGQLVSCTAQSSQSQDPVWGGRALYVGEVGPKALYRDPPMDRMTERQTRLKTLRSHNFISGP